MKLKAISAISVIAFIFFASIIYYVGANSENADNGQGVSFSDSEYVDSNEKVKTNSGDISATNQDIATFQLTLDEVSKHKTSSDCWLAIDSRVYDVTSYINQHPGGTREILNHCGKNASTAFASMGGKGKIHSFVAQQLLRSFYVGDVGSSITINLGLSSTADNTTSDQTNTTNTPTFATTNIGTTSGNPFPEQVKSKYPDATLISGKYEDEGEWEGKVNTSVGCRKIKVGTSGSILKDEKC